MITTSVRPTRKISSLFGSLPLKRGMAWGLMIIGAWIAFEIFNYSTTDFALTDVLGDLRFLGVRWATILALAFCLIDIAGIARIFTPEQGKDEPMEVWYLFGAWLLAAAMNAILTWWGVSVAIANHTSFSAGVVVSANTMTKVVPVFVAMMVWLIRVLIIGKFSVAGDRLFSHAERHEQVRSSMQASTSSGTVRTNQLPLVNPFRPVPKTARSESVYGRQEPTYHKVSVSARPVREAEYVDTPRNA